MVYLPWYGFLCQGLSGFRQANTSVCSIIQDPCNRTRQEINLGQSVKQYKLLPLPHSKVTASYDCLTQLHFKPHEH